MGSQRVGHNWATFTETVTHVVVSWKKQIFNSASVHEGSWCSCVLICPTLCDSLDCSLPGSSVYGILQARLLEWIATSSSRGSSQPRNWTCVSCIAGGFFTKWATREALLLHVKGSQLMEKNRPPESQWDLGGTEVPFSALLLSV